VGDLLCKLLELFFTDSCRDLSAELPFVLMHPKPEEDEPLLPLPKSSSPNHLEAGEVPTENLIQLDTYVSLEFSDTKNIEQM